MYQLRVVSPNLILAKAVCYMEYVQCHDIVDVVNEPLNYITDFIYEKSGVECSVDILVLEAVFGGIGIHAGTNGYDSL